MVRVVIPVSDMEAENLSEHFGRAPYFAWFDIEAGKVSKKGVVSNDSEHFGGTGHPPDRILILKPNVVVTSGMGMRAIMIFQNAGVAVLQAQSTLVEDALKDYNGGRLKELTEGCLHSHAHA